MSLSFRYHLFSYKFRTWIFRWNVDEGGDLTLSIARYIHLTKYKENTIIRFGRKDYKPARKHVNAD